MHLEMEAQAPHTQNHKNWVPLLDEPAYEPRRLRVVCVGAGYSGLMLAYEAKYNESLQGFIDLTIYEKAQDVGGTWLANRYPGVAVRYITNKFHGYG
jgi:cation diffusion facilitator CzcD-associated flavoprotein CzcO